MTRLGPLVRRRLTGASVLLAAALVLAGCGSGAKPPPEGAARVVPADALAYIHLSLDRSDGAVAQAESAVRGLAGYRSFVAGLRNRLSAITGTRFSTQIEPWLGSELAVAFLPAGASAGEMIVLGVRNRARARAFVAEVGGGARARLVDGYVVVGEPATVAQAGRGRSLADSRAYQQGQSAAPGDRVLDAYGSGGGLAELLDGHTGLPGVGAAVLGAEDPSTVTAALSPTSDGLKVWVRMTGIPPGSTATFRPVLESHLPADTSWVVQMSSLTGSAPGLLSILASASSFGSGPSAVSSLVDKLGPALQAEGLAPGPLQSLFNHQSAIFDLDNGVGLMTRTDNTKAARLELGNAGQALAALFAATTGDSGTAAPLVNTSIEQGVAVTQFDEGTGAQLDLAVFNGVIVITTSRTAIDAIIDQKNPLSASSLYQSVISTAGRSAGPVLYGAITRLVRHGGAAGLLQSLGLDGATRVLAQINAAGMASTSGGTQSTAELFFTIS